jgi:inner membrane transporter RhtA
MRRDGALQRTGVLWGVAATIGAMVSVQSGAAIAIPLFAAVGPVGVVAVRLVTASAFLTATARPPVAVLRTPRAATLAAFGLVIAATNCFFYLAIERVPLGVCVALEMVGPIAVALIGSRRLRDVVAVALAIPSVLVLALAHGVDGPVTVSGVAFALAAGACWGLYILLSAHHARRLPGAQGLALAMLMAALPVVLIAAGTAGAQLLSARVIIVGAVVGLLSTALPGTLDTVALRRLRSPTYALVLSLSPAVAALAGYAIRGQRLSLFQWAGVALVMVASAIAVAGAEPPDAVMPDAAPVSPPALAPALDGGLSGRAGS